MRPHPCCDDERNLGPVEVEADAGPGETFRRCQVCEARHFSVELEPGLFEVAAPDNS